MYLKSESEPEPGSGPESESTIPRFRVILQFMVSQSGLALLTTALYTPFLQSDLLLSSG